MTDTSGIRPEWGTVLAVTTENVGGSTLADAAAGATTVAVSNAWSFDETGGTVTVGGVPTEFLTVDQDTGVMTLAAALAEVVPEDTPVEVWPAAPVKTALVDFGIPESEAVEVLVPHALAAVLGDGIRDDANRETALVAERGPGELVVVDVAAAAVPSPGNATYRTPEDTLPPASALRVGDLWIDGDNSNATWRWDGAGWVDVHNLNVDLAYNIAAENADDIAANSEQIVLLNQQIDELTIVADDAEKTADTADGRVSMSDYEPTPDDVTYTVVHYNPSTGLYEPTTLSRNEGSVWFQRTRPRQNLITNPSIEKNATGWQATNAAAVRHLPTDTPAVAGDYCLRVTSTATGNAYVEPTYTFPADEKEWYAGSMFMQLVSGSGVGCFATIGFYDAGNVLLLTVTGEVENLAAPPPSAENWNRINVVAQAPAGTAYLRVRFHNPNPSAVWYLDAATVENLDELGRYFDGDSYDGFWEGGTGNPQQHPEDNPGPGETGWQESTARLYGDKIIGVWELHSAAWVRKFFTEDTLDQIDAAKITNLGSLTLADNSVATDKMDVSTVLASEALTAGDLVHIYDLAGAFRVRRANAAAGAGYPASGFVLTDVAVNLPVRVYPTGANPFLAGLAPGPKWLAETPGAVSNLPPDTIGATVQQVGYAADTFLLNFAPLNPIRIV